MRVVFMWPSSVGSGGRHDARARADTSGHGTTGARAESGELAAAGARADTGNDGTAGDATDSDCGSQRYGHGNYFPVHFINLLCVDVLASR
jgi:hypothetical protein